MAAISSRPSACVIAAPSLRSATSVMSCSKRRIVLRIERTKVKQTANTTTTNPVEMASIVTSRARLGPGLIYWNCRAPNTLASRSA